MAPSIIIPNRVPASGWVGGFEETNPHFGYPDPDLRSLRLTGDHENDGLIQRQVRVLWPEFTWRTVQGDETSRCFQMFAPDISRAGYTDKGRIWSIICPQQGAALASLGNMNIEVTVTRVRGWIDEKADTYTNLLAADMTAVGKIWFSPSSQDKVAYSLLKALLEAKGLPFPYDKAHAILVDLHEVDNRNEPAIEVRSGLSDVVKDYPSWTLHMGDAWGVANVSVEIGPVLPTGNEIVDDFNALVLDLFNLASGNILQQGNVLTWNVWFDAPTHESPNDWRKHAAIWRHSIDVDHRSPDGPGTPPRYADGTYFKPVDAVIQAEWDKINAWLEKHVGITLPDIPPADWGGPALEPGPVASTTSR